MPWPVLGVGHEVKARHDPVLHIGIAEWARHAGSTTAAGARTGAFPWAVLVGLAYPMDVIASGTLDHLVYRLSLRLSICAFQHSITTLSGCFGAAMA